MASSRRPDPAAVRMQRSAFLASLGRPVSPPPPSLDAGERHGLVKDSCQSAQPIAIGLYSDEETAPATKKQRLQHPAPPLTLPSVSVDAPRRIETSPFHLIRVADLPESDNIDTVTLHDILGNPLIREAWIFNYCFDVDWTMQHFDVDIRNLVSVKIIHGSWKTEDRNRQGIDDACQRWANVEAIRAYLPDAFGTHHTKLIVLLNHDDSAEIIIHTANMQAGDWTHATQAVWRSPLLPRERSPSQALSDDLRLGYGARFKLDFLRYLEAYGRKLDQLVQEVSKHDFSSIRGALVGSVPSKVKNTQGRAAKKELWGHPAMYHAISEIQTGRQKGPRMFGRGGSQQHIVCQCSSVATLAAGWLEGTLIPAMSANSATTFSIVYPTGPEVGNSLDGYGCGSSIHMKAGSPAHQKQVAAMQPYLCRWNGVSDSDSSGRTIRGHARRGFAAPHVKTYISFKSIPTAASPSPEINWALLTSANLSKQAWGTEMRIPTEKGKRSKFDVAEAEVKIQSFELGVLVWPELWEDDAGEVAMIPVFGKDLPSSDSLGTASTIVGLRMPYDLPLAPYTANDIPWCSDVPHSEPDRHGRSWPPDASWLS